VHHVIDRRAFLASGGRLGAAAVVGGTALAAAARALAAVEKQTVRVGLFTDTTGIIGGIGAGHAIAYELAVEDVNRAGGVLGQPLRTSLVDSKSDPSAAILKVRQLIETQHVDALVGGIFSSTRDAVLPIIANRAKKIYLYPMTYEGSACNANLFLTGAVAQQNLLPAVDYALRQGARRWVLLGHDYIFPHVANGLARKLIESRGGKVLGEKYYPLDATDFSDAVRAVTNAKADAVVNNITPPGMFTFYKQLGASGWRNTVVATGLDQTAVPAVGAANLRGTIVSLDYVITLPGAVNVSIRERYAKKAHGKSTWSPGLGYGGAYRAIRFLAAAINEAGTTDTAKVRAALVGLTLDDLPGGPARIEADHHTSMNMYVAGFKADGSMRIIKRLGVVKPRQSCHF
jgi:ABC-type branched-subunit amino acid transport system substrate-binding protein